ncbi:MAG: penicillin-binding protein 2 [Candidatus Saccharibacteria bacterium]|nr:penicillin-binding protein 2 [Candidatus Saccharibacteria bacterium]
MTRSRQVIICSEKGLSWIIGGLAGGFLILAVFLFFLQIVDHEKWLAEARATQIKSLEIEAERGKIYAFNNGQKVPLVINERRWTMFADGKFIDYPVALAEALEDLGIPLTAQQKLDLASRDKRYIVLAKRVTDGRKNEIIRRLHYEGIHWQENDIRQYLEGDLASHVLGFLNYDSNSQYGIEQYYDKQLTGQPGWYRRTTDVHDVPLLFTSDNIEVQPQDGQDVVLTLDVSLQRIVETQLLAGIEETDALGGTAIVLDANDGAVLAMASQPEFSPANFTQAQIGDYVNPAVENILEPASVMKVLVMASALNEGVVEIDESFYDPNVQVIDGRVIPNFVSRGAAVRPVTEILIKSLNTGTIEMLKRLDKHGSNDTIDVDDRQVLYDYYTKVFRLDKKTGIDLPNEIVGQINSPDIPYLPNHLYATMTFGQSVAVSPIQLAAVYGAIFNGGNYYQPYIAAQVGDQIREPKLLASNILADQTIADLRFLMETMGKRLLPTVQYEGLEVSAKTGTAQIIDFENGGYLDDVARGLMLGYVKSSTKTLIILVIVDQPQVVYAGSQGAQPIWENIVQQLVSLGRTH